MTNKGPNAWKYEKRLDFDGNELKLGDIIVTISPYYRELEKAKIIKITPKKISIQMTRYDDSDEFNGGITTRYSDQVIKLCKNNKT